MRDLNRYVTRKYAIDWYDIGIELGLELDVNIIEKDNPQQSVTCFQRTLDKWLKLSTDDATWRTLEVALTNVNRAWQERHKPDQGSHLSRVTKFQDFPRFLWYIFRYFLNYFKSDFRIVLN